MPFKSKLNATWVCLKISQRKTPITGRIPFGPCFPPTTTFQPGRQKRALTSAGPALSTTLAEGCRCSPDRSTTHRSHSFKSSHELLGSKSGELISPGETDQICHKCPALIVKTMPSSAPRLARWAFHVSCWSQWTTRNPRKICAENPTPTPPSEKTATRAQAGARLPSGSSSHLQLPGEPVTCS